MRPRALLCGSFHRKPTVLRRLFHELEVTGCRVLSPITLDFIDQSKAFMTTQSEADLSSVDIERFHLRAIRDADFVLLHAPDGHVGLSTSYEIGFASALAKPVFSYEQPADTMLQNRVQQASSVYEILDMLQLIYFLGYFNKSMLFTKKYYVCYYIYMSELYIPITMTSKGTFTLPASIRKEFGLQKQGDKIMLRYTTGSKKVELEAPVDFRALQAEVARHIPATTPPVTDIRTFLDQAKLAHWQEKCNHEQ